MIRFTRSVFDFFIGAALFLLIGAAVFALVSIFAAARGYDWLVALLTPPAHIARLRLAKIAAQCRHRLSFAGGLFVAASPA